MKEIIIATKNKGKVKDFEVLFSKKNIKVKSLLDFSEAIDVEETGETFQENAILKAETISKQFNKMVIADDSGLSIDILEGRPGVYSARYAGKEKDDTANINKVLTELEGVPFEKRTAKFHCSLAIAIPGKETTVVDGECKGIITEKPIGEQGFGYDPIFFVPNKNATMAQLSKEEKNDISHRAAAMAKLERLWDDLFSEAI